MTKVEMTRETLLRIGGFTTLTAKQLVGKQVLKKDLKISADRLQFLASDFTNILKQAGKKRFVMASTLRADGFKVADCVTLMMEKGFDIVKMKPEDVTALIAEAKKEL